MKQTWIRFELLGFSRSRKTKIFAVLTKDTGAILGRIAWHAPWRCYAFFPAADTVFERNCLQDIMDLLDMPQILLPREKPK
jgi:hypothetical protein